MTVSSTTVKNSYSGNGSTTEFAYTFKIFADSDLQVIIRSAAGTETTKTLTTHYTVAGAGDTSGGSITFTAGNIPTATQTVLVRREVPQTQAIDYIANDPFPAESHEEGLDRSAMNVQQLQEEVDRSIKLSRTNTMTSTEFTVGATDRANKILAFDASGEISVTQELGTYKGTDATTTTEAYNTRDLVKSTTAGQLNNIYICIADSVIGDTLTDTDHFALLVDAYSAASSATAAATSETNAETAQTAAEAAQAAAETAETNAETAETNAETAQAAAEAALDSFDDRYLGAKSSAPSTDNDGNALLTGALYFNSTSSQIFNWTAANAWEAIKPTSTEQTAINALAADAVIADMAILATTDVVADMNVLATNDVVADMNTLGTADVVTDMNVLATSDVVTDMNILATSANVTAMGLLGTSANVTAMSNVSGDIANVNITATNITDVNTFAVRYRIGSSDPTSSLDEGDLAFNTTDNNLKFYNGTSWVSISPGIANVVDDSSPELGGDLDLNNNDIIGTGGIPSANLTGTINIARLADGSITLAKLSATGTKDGTTFLRGDNTFAAAGGGLVLQVVHASHATGVTQTADSYATSGLTATITPASTSNKVLVLASLACRTFGDGSSSSGRNAPVSLFRGTVAGTNLQLQNAGVSDRTASSSTGTQGFNNVPFNVLDSPNTTSAQTYTVGISGSGATDIQAQAESNKSTITLIEIAG